MFSLFFIVPFQYNFIVMLVQTLSALFSRDLLKLKAEINAYQTASNLWKVEPGIGNSAGNLCLHLMGNLNHFIGATLGLTGYVRDRPKEFSDKDIPVKKLNLMIDETINMVHSVLSNFSSENLSKEFPLLVFEEKTSNEYMLVHLSTHLAYHLGQINYHRRLIDHR